MHKWSLSLLVGLIATASALGAEPQWRAGIARQEITPRESIWMGGYASRNHPSEGVLQPLWAKALVLEDQQGSRVVFLTMDLIGIDRPMSDAVGRRAFASTGIPRERIIVNISHTHSGPVVAGVTNIVYDLDPQQQAAVNAYAKTLEDQLVAVIEAAVKDLRPAALSFGEGKATFGANRRAMRGKKNAPPDPAAPVDHGVPVLAVRDQQGKLRGVLFGYACHSTTTGFYQINGDYPGYAQAALETGHDGATALFMAGCGADVNPYPRGEIALAQQHGQSLATAVDAVLGSPMCSLGGPLKVAFQRVDVKFVDPPGKEQIEELLQNKNVYKQRLAKHLLAELAAGRALPTSYPYPIQVVRFGNDLVLVALAGETVVDYALRLRREFAGRRIWIGGFCNEIFAYVPNERILKEGGYEGGEAMVYFGLHGPFQAGLEDSIITTAKRMATEP